MPDLFITLKVHCKVCIGSSSTLLIDRPFLFFFSFLISCPFYRLMFNTRPPSRLDIRQIQPISFSFSFHLSSRALRQHLSTQKLQPCSSHMLPPSSPFSPYLVYLQLFYMCQIQMVKW